MPVDATTLANFLTLSRTQPELFVQQHTFTHHDVLVTFVAEGIVILEPTKQQSDTHIVLSCGVHGNETAPIEICDAMLQDIAAGTLKLAHRVMFLFGNLPAMDIAERFVEENMNRLFCGAHTQEGVDDNAERIRARQLEAAVSGFFAKAESGDTKIHYDLHTAIRDSKNEKFAVYPFLHGGKYSLSQLAFLADCGVRTILLSESPTTTFSYYSSLNHGAHAFTVELGKVRAFGENDMSKFADADSALRDLVSTSQYEAKSTLQSTELFRVNQIINRHQEDFALHFSDDAPNFTGFQKGDLLASETGADYPAQVDGEAIVFPNANVALGQRALLTVVPCELESLNVQA